MTSELLPGAVARSAAPPACFLAGTALNLATGNTLWFFAGGVAAIAALTLTARYTERLLERPDSEWFAIFTPAYFRQVVHGTRVPWKVAAAPAWLLIGLLALGWIAVVVLGVLGVDSDGG